MTTAMKSIVYRGGVVAFRIPAHWQEVYSDIEGGMFYEDHDDSGTLRLKIITMTTPEGLSSAIDMIQVIGNSLKNNVKGRTRDRKDGNAVFKYEEASFERGKRIVIFYWVVANPLPPRHARVATFSYTILANQRNLEQVQHDLEMLEAEIDSATFSPQLGAIPQ